MTRYDLNILNKSIFFSSLCNAAACLAVPFCRKEKIGRFQTKLNMLNSYSAFGVSKIFFAGLSVIEVPYCIIRLFIVLRSGYQGVRAFEDLMPSLFSLIDQMYVPSVILCIIYSEKNKKVYTLTLIVWAIITALNGDRSSGIAALVIVALLYSNGIINRSNRFENKPRKVKKIYIGVAAMFLFAIWLIPFAHNFRNHVEGTSSNGLIDTVVDAIGELGFSFFPLVATMLVCPSKTGFLYGKTIVFSFLSSIIPLSIDFTGIFRKMYEISKTGAYWLTEYYQFSFGLGYSLNAESYSNFGMYGFIWIFILSILVARVLSQPNYQRTDNKFSQYASFAMLYILFTMPRRSCFYLSNFYIYYIVIIGLMLKLFASSNKSNCGTNAL